MKNPRFRELTQVPELLHGAHGMYVYPLPYRGLWGFCLPLYHAVFHYTDILSFGLYISTYDEGLQPVSDANALCFILENILSKTI